MAVNNSLIRTMKMVYSRKFGWQISKKKRALKSFIDIRNTNLWVPLCGLKMFVGC
jgi:hypothetical protein